MLLCSVAHLVQRFRGEILFQLDQFEIHTGDKIGLIGANGCGKTTLLKLLARGMRTRSGRDHQSCTDPFLSSAAAA